MKLVIPGELTDLNKYDKANRGNKYAGAGIKEEETNRVAMECRIARTPEVPEEMYPVRISYHWYSKDKRLDIDNVAFAKKFINDGLVLAGVLENDSRKYVGGFGQEEFFIDSKNPRVEVFIEKMLK